MSEYNFLQTQADTTWIINHGFGEDSVVVDLIVEDGGINTKGFPIDTTHTDNNTLTLTFASPTIGRARLISSGVVFGSGTGVVPIFDLSNVTYDTISLDVTSQQTIARTLIFDDVGTSLYTIDQVSGFNRIDKYTLTSAFDLSSASFSSQIDFSTGEGTVLRDLHYNSDGTKVFISYDTNNRVVRYSLGTPYDLGTASFDTGNFKDVSAQTINPYGVALSVDGTKMIVAEGDSPSVLYAYDLSVAFDLTTAVYNGETANLQNDFPLGILFNPDGTRLFVATSASPDAIQQYSLGTAYDLTTLSFVQNYITTAQDNAPTGIAMNTTGTKMYHGGGNQMYFQYTLS